MTTTIRQPKVNVNIVNANVAVENTEQKILFVGQKTVVGTATALALNESIPNDGSEDTLFGRDSMLATMIRANKIRNQQVQVDAIALDDDPTVITIEDVATLIESGGVATVTTTGTHGLITGDIIIVTEATTLGFNLVNVGIVVTTTFVFTYEVAIGLGTEGTPEGVIITSSERARSSILIEGTATENGTLTFIAGSERRHKFDIAINDNDTDAEIGPLIVAAVNVDLNTPVILVYDAPAMVVRIKATNRGSYGESIPIEIRGEVAGITTMVGGMVGGGADPVLTTVFDAIGENRYQAIVWPYPNDTTEVLALLDPRFNADGKVLDGVAFTALADTVSNLKALGAALNSQSLVIFGDQEETETNYAGPSIVEIPMVVASYFAGFRGLRLDTDGFSIADLVITTNGPLDSFGGPALASKPYFNTPFADLVPMQVGRGFDDPEIEDLKDNGITVIGNNIVNNTVITGEVVTTYKTDFAANPDVTFTFLNYVDTASQSREYFFNNLRARFAQSRLTEGDVIKGRDMANELVIRSFLKRLYQDLSGTDFVLLEAGEVALVFFDENLIIDIDKANGKVTIQMTVPIVTQLREIAATLKIAFDTQA